MQNRSEYDANLALSGTSLQQVLKSNCLAMLLVSIDGVPKGTLIALDPYVVSTADGFLQHARLLSGGHIYVKNSEMEVIGE